MTPRERALFEESEFTCPSTFTSWRRAYLPSSRRWCGHAQRPKPSPDTRPSRRTSDTCGAPRRPSVPSRPPAGHLSKVWRKAGRDQKDPVVETRREFEPLPDLNRDLRLRKLETSNTNRSHFPVVFRVLAQAEGSAMDLRTAKHATARMVGTYETDSTSSNQQTAPVNRHCVTADGLDRPESYLDIHLADDLAVLAFLPFPCPTRGTRD